MGKRIRISKEDEKKIINYYKSGKSILWISKQMTLGYPIIRRILAENNVEIDPQRKAHKHSFDLDFLEKQSENLAYFIGLMSTDGCVSAKSNRIYIELQLSDKETLDKIRNAMNLTREVKEYETSKGYKNAKLYLENKRAKEIMIYYGVIPNKTYDPNYKPPYNLDEEYFIHYLRGAFDGDGSVKKTGKYFSFQIDVNTVAVANYIVENLRKVGIDSDITINKHKSGYELYRVYFYGKEKGEKLYNLFYKHKPELFMKRKFNKFTSLLEDDSII